MSSFPLLGKTEYFTWTNSETDVTKIALSFYSGLFAYNGWWVLMRTYSHFSCIHSVLLSVNPIHRSSPPGTTSTSWSRNWRILIATFRRPSLSLVFLSCSCIPSQLSLSTRHCQSLKCSPLKPSQWTSPTNSTDGWPGLCLSSLLCPLSEEWMAFCSHHLDFSSLEQRTTKCPVCCAWFKWVTSLRLRPSSQCVYSHWCISAQRILNHWSPM